MRLNERLLFKENSSKLTADDKRILDSMADAIKSGPKDKTVIVSGFTDDSEGGKDAAAKRWQLSSTRALEVAKYLLARGLDPGLIGIAGFGQARPIAPNDTLANKALNRRVEIALLPKNQSMGTIDVKPAELGPKK
jgi:chemotaxis protein MotB